MKYGKYILVAIMLFLFLGLSLTGPARQVARDQRFADTSYSSSNIDNYMYCADTESGYPVARDLYAIEFVSTKFHDSVSLSVGIFNGPVYFSMAVFDKKANFRNAQFRDMSDFTNVSFKGKVFFQNDSFYGPVNFKKVIFSDYANFTNCTFLSAAYFDSCHSAGRKMNFSNSYFNDNIHFEKATLAEAMIFNYDTIKGNIFFDSAVFSKRLSFVSACFSPGANIFFRHAVLPDTLDLSGISGMPREIDIHSADFTNSKFYHRATDGYTRGKFHYLYLFKTDVSKLLLDYSHFRLLFVDPVSKKRLASDEISSIYEAVLNNFKSRGQTESYDALDIEYHDYKWTRYKYFSWFHMVPHYWNGYGHHPANVFGWTLIFLLFFTIVNSLFLPFLSKVYAFEPAKIGDAKRWPKRLWSSFVYTSALFFLVRINFEKITFDKKLGTLYILLIYTSGLLCLAYMANFVLQK